MKHRHGLTFRIVPCHQRARSGRQFDRTLFRVEVALGLLGLPERSPNLTPHIERFMGSLKEECLLKMIFSRAKMLRTAS